MTQIIDYAGLFPPAKLELEEAFKNYIEYKNSDYKWILSRFICPANQLSNLENLIKKNCIVNNDINFSVLGRSGYNTIDFKKNLDEDLYYWKGFSSNSSGINHTNLFEVKLPDELITLHDQKKNSELIDYIFESVERQIPHPVFIFFEVHSGSEWKKNICGLIEGIKIHNDKNNNSGFKFRTGGIEPNSFPTPGQIAFCIRECVDREIPMKCTAGLHHPFRRYDKNINVMMHGFINVFAAGIIALRHNITDTGLENILSDEDHNNFIFKEDYFSWKDWKVSIADIEFARKELMISFGSCSFDEPINDLKSFNIFN